MACRSCVKEEMVTAVDSVAIAKANTNVVSTVHARQKSIEPLVFKEKEITY